MVNFSLPQEIWNLIIFDLIDCSSVYNFSLVCNDFSRLCLEKETVKLLKDKFGVKEKFYSDEKGGIKSRTQRDKEGKKHGLREEWYPSKDGGKWPTNQIG